MPFNSKKNDRRTRRTLRQARLATALLALAGAQAASAVELNAGDWTIDVGGFINAYYTGVDCSGDTVNGVALAGQALGCGGEDSRTTIGNGLLPNALVTKFSSTQGDYEVGGQISIMAHTATSSSIAANSGVDVRQAFFTVGNDGMGTVKLGRDYGIFGSGAILGDMTLIGAGAPVQATQRGRVTLGHIGAGYTYLGHYGQITWSSPTTESGFGFKGGLFSPVDNGGDFVSKSGPQLQGQISFGSGAFKGWVGAKAQKFHPATGAPEDLESFTMRGAEAGVSVSAGAFGLLANVQAGKGLGILADGDQGDLKSVNWLVQGTFQASEKMKFGLNYGISKNDDDGEDIGAVKSNANATAGLYYGLTKSVTLVAEIGQTRSKDFDGNTARMNGASLGGIVFF